ncbi:cold-shock protein [uncultured Fluviicola sp.]|uniref:cold-shock protein n=1 Tax=uncultured Fluviicola sp. TaxID=463303 RepID=UPI0025E9776A|nr:cold shock domain-containing protein [uncultured Fluviicola sp.]
MARSQESFNKKEIQNKKDKKRKEKEKKMLERKENGKASFEDMIVYIDENGNQTTTPPDNSKRVEFNAEDIVIGVPKREDVEPEDKIRKGTVTFYNDSKGYGFIKDSTSGDSVFVHANQLTEAITEGNRVIFEVEKGQRGPTAVRVKKD